MDTLHYWRYCLSIERNLEKTIDFVEVCYDNDSAYSYEYAKIILLACSEIDVICRLLCKTIDPATDFDDSSTRTGNIREYANIILRRFPQITTFGMHNTSKRCPIIPFYGWSINPQYTSPSWWDDYQKIKHYRHEKYELATQSNAFFAVSGLITLNLYLHRLIKNQPYSDPHPHPSLFDSSVFSPNLIASADRELPDFEVTP